MWGLMAPLSHNVSFKERIKEPQKSRSQFSSGRTDHCFLIFIDVVHTHKYTFTRRHSVTRRNKCLIYAREIERKKGNVVFIKLGET